MASVSLKARPKVINPVRGLRPPPRRPPLKRTPIGLPIPHVKNILVRSPGPSRLSDHYHNTIAPDLLYMTYIHEPCARPPLRVVRKLYDENDPYTKNRPNPLAGGAQAQVGRKPAPPTTPDNVVKLVKIQLMATSPADAVANKASLVPLIAAFRALSGENASAGGRLRAEGVQLVRSRRTVGAWKLRPGVPVGVKVDIQGSKMYDFIATLTEFVLPKLRDFEGFDLPTPSSNPYKPSAVAGVVSIGLPKIAMGFFPQIEVNLDTYPKEYGMYIHFITDAKGHGAQSKAIQLMSGFQVPFARR